LSLLRSLRLFLCATTFAAFAGAQISSTVSLTSSQNPSVLGQPLTLTATVTPGSTGKVTFYEGVDVLGTSTLSGSTAAFTTRLLPAGTGKLRAHYLGDAAHTPGNSASLTHTVMAQPSGGLRTPLNIGVTGIVFAEAVGDFNGDGKPDLFLGYFRSNSGAEVRLGNGDGTFQPPIAIPVSYVTSAAVGDFNGDGKQDLAIVSSGTSTLAVVLGNGDGTFGPPATYPYSGVSNDPTVSVGDLNNDGIPDLVMSFFSSVGVQLGNGDGTFKSVVKYTTSNAYVAALGDFNNDGNTDVVVGGESTTSYSILLGNGDGTLQASIVFPAPGYTTSIVVGDFNRDGNADIAFCDSETPEVFVFLGNGNATFQSGAEYPVMQPSSVGLGDIDGDGNTDLIVTAADDLTPILAVLPGKGDGTFQAAVTYLATVSLGNFEGTVFGNYVAVADFNGDGKTDVAAATDLFLGGAGADLSISIAPGPGFTAGQAGATYSIVVTNVSSLTTSGAISVVDTLPVGFTATAITGTGWNCTLATLTCMRSDPLSEQTAYPSIVVTVNISQSVTGDAINTAMVSGSGSSNMVTSSIFIRTLAPVTLGATPSPADLGQSVTMTASTNAAATGEMTFFAGINPLGSAGVAAGRASFTTTLLPSGTVNLFAVYSGDANFGSNTSPAYSETITPVPSDGLFPPSSYYLEDIGYLAVGDFNLDGNPDLVATADTGSGATGTVNIFLGKGDGTFRNPLAFPSGDEAGQVVVADFNLDGKPDLAEVGMLGIYLLLGNGDGTFQPFVKYSQQNLVGLATADFNHDGIPDILAVDSGAGVYVYLGNGDGTFQTPIFSAASEFSGWAIADFNGDGIPDLVYLTQVINVQLGNGDGTFQPPISTPQPGFDPQALCVGDFNGDGKTDVILADATGRYYALLGNGNGTFLAPIVTAGSAGGTLVPVDVNGDGKLDLLSTSYGEAAITVSLGNGDGSFQPSVFLLNTTAKQMVTADFNRDGKVDIAATWPNQMYLYFGVQIAGLNVGSGHSGSFVAGETGATYQLTVGDLAFTASSGTVTVVDTLPAGFTAAGISGTGWSCVLGTLTCTRSDGLEASASYPPITVTVNVSGSLSPGTVNNRVSVTTSAGSNVAMDATVIVVGTTTSLSAQPSSATLGQSVSLTATISAGATGQILFLDQGAPVGIGIIAGGQAQVSTPLFTTGAHYLTVLYGGDSAHAVSTSAEVTLVVRSSPGPAFGTPGSYQTGGGSAAVAVGDFNGDGKIDIATANTTANSVSVLLGNGDGTFRSNFDYSVGAQPVGLSIGDFNGDGKQDLVSVNQAGDSVSILLGNGDGTFQPPLTSSAGLSPTAVGVGDFNGDGQEDLAIGSGPGNSIGIYLGNGNGTFQLVQVIPGAIFMGSILVQDLNRDGKPDLVTGEYTYKSLLGNGDGTFTETSWIGNGSGAPALGDFNGDGIPDLALANQNTPNGTLSVALGNGDGTFSTNPSYSVTSFDTFGVAVADFNGDGKLDVLGFSPNNSSVEIALGTGTGSLGAISAYPVGVGPGQMVAADFTGDGRTDLAAVSASSSVTVLLAGESAPQPDAFFNGEQSVGAGWDYLNFPNGNLFGYYFFLQGSASTPTAIFDHADLGYEYIQAATSGGAFFFDFASGHWWYTSASLFPYLYDFTLNSWIYYFPNTNSPGHYTTNPRYFSNLTSGMIFTM
jgi:hypothetical protein